MIGDIMLLIPGLLLVNAIKEMFNRDIVTGLYRLIERCWWHWPLPEATLWRSW